MSALAGLLQFVFSPIGRLVTVAILCLSVGFWQGWRIKAKIDDAATARAVIAKQRIDLQAAKETAEEATAVAATLTDTDAKNQEIIRDLQAKLSQQPSAVCTLDDPTASELRRLR